MAVQDLQVVQIAGHSAAVLNQEVVQRAEHSAAVQDQEVVQVSRTFCWSRPGRTPGDGSQKAMVDRYIYSQKLSRQPCPEHRIQCLRPQKLSRQPSSEFKMSILETTDLRIDLTTPDMMDRKIGPQTKALEITEPRVEDSILESTDIRMDLTTPEVTNPKIDSTMPNVKEVKTNLKISEELGPQARKSESTSQGKTAQGWGVLRTRSKDRGTPRN